MFENESAEKKMRWSEEGRRRQKRKREMRKGKRETAYTVCRLNNMLIGEGSGRSITKETRQ